MAFSLQEYFCSHSISDILKERTSKQRQQTSLVVILAKHQEVLSDDLIVEILSWLPVKTLLQFKCVCKSWYTIIKSSHFISKHIQHYYNNHDSDCFLVYYQVTQAGEIEVYKLLLNETHNKVLAYDELHDFPIYSSDICGPCDGLYYLYLGWKEKRALWNPALNELKMLPPIIERPTNLPIDLYYVGNEVYGFGYDPSSKDYKVIVIQGQWGDKRDMSFDAIDIADPSSVHIYSTRTNNWRYWGNLAHNYLLQTNRCYVIVNGCCYWLGYLVPYDRDYEVIVCFDIVNEEYHEISVPKYGKFVYRNLAIHDDSIAFLSVDKEKHLHIWTLNDNKGVWMKKYSMGPHLGLWNPIGHWKNNKILLQYGNTKIVICDTNTQEITDIEFIKVGYYCYGTFVYQESLVSLKD